MATAASKVSLSYDALREWLEAIALEEGYNHECYGAFLVSVLAEEARAELFGEIRKERNAINYYGKAISTGEASRLIRDIQDLLEHFRA